MPQLRSHSSLGPRGRYRPARAVRRTLVSPVVTELTAVLQPVCRDPFLDGDVSGPRTDITRTRRRAAAGAR